MTTNAIANATSAFILRTPSRVYCPGCGYALTQKTFHVSYGIIWCVRCGERPIHPHDWLAFALRWNGFAADWLTVRGVRFWVPEHPETGITAKYIRDRRSPNYSMEQLEHCIGMEEEHERKLRERSGEEGTRNAT